jgi:uncharacterized membrane protein YhaH (DUF805 family)
VQEQAGTEREDRGADIRGTGIILLHQVQAWVGLMMNSTAVIVMLSLVFTIVFVVCWMGIGMLINWVAQGME